MIRVHKSIDFLKNSDNSIKKNIVFLDIDGVIQGYSNQSRFNMDEMKLRKYLVDKYNDSIYSVIDFYDLLAAYFDWDEIALGYLKDILRSHNAYLVIHSGWRETVSKEHLIALFKLYDMDGYILDVLPTGKKEIVIQDYLNSHPEILNYAVIDDDSMVSTFGCHFCQTYNVLNHTDYIYLNHLFYSNYLINSIDCGYELFKNNKRTISANMVIKKIKDINVVFLNFITEKGVSAYDILYFYNEIKKLLYQQGLNYIVLQYFDLDIYGLLNKYSSYKMNDFFILFEVVNEKGFKGQKYFKDNKSVLLDISEKIFNRFI